MSRLFFPIHLLLLLRLPAEQATELILYIQLVCCNFFIVSFDIWWFEWFLINDFNWSIWQSFMVNGRISFSTSTPKTSTTTTNENNNENEAKLVKSASQDRVADINILRTLATYIWVKDNFEFRLRIITALAFLVGAKVTLISTPSSSLLLSIGWGSKILVLFIAGCEYSGAFPLQACCWLANDLFQQCCCSRFLHNRQFNCSGSFRHPSFRFDWIWDCAGVFFCFQRYYYTEVIANSCPHFILFLF